MFPLTIIGQFPYSSVNPILKLSHILGITVIAHLSGCVWVGGYILLGCVSNFLFTLGLLQRRMSFKGLSFKPTGFFLLTFFACRPDIFSHMSTKVWSIFRGSTLDLDPAPDPHLGCNFLTLI